MNPPKVFDITVVKNGVSDLEELFQISIEEEMEDLETLARAISPVIEQLLNRNFEKLLQICYRLDLGERRLNRILWETPTGEITKILSMAIVERQLLKVHYRKLYS